MHLIIHQAGMVLGHIVQNLLKEDFEVDIILKGHAFCEKELVRLTKKTIDKNNIIEKKESKFSFRYRIVVLYAAGAIDKEHFEMLSKLNSLRNDAAHGKKIKLK